MNDQFLGQLMLFAGDFAPNGWADCNGQLLPIRSNSALFSLLGVTYGGDGVNSFALPDLRGRVATHQGKGIDLTETTLGQSYGKAGLRLTTANMPAHTHTATGNARIKVSSSDDEDAQDPTGKYLRRQPPPAEPSTDHYYATPGDKLMGPVNANIVITPTGQSAPVDMMQPSLTMRYCIALSGIYPSRE